MAGGTQVSIWGSRLEGATVVDFGSTAASAMTVVSDHEITATSPAGVAGSVDVTVTTPSGTSATSPGDQFTYGVPVPVVRHLDPRSGPVAGGTQVSIDGSNFDGASPPPNHEIPPTSPANVERTVGATATTPAHPNEAPSGYVPGRQGGGAANGDPGSGPRGH